MKAGIGLVATCAGVFVALLLQQALPAVHALHGARLVLVPLIFCLAAMALPFPVMLVAAFFTGLLCDLMYLHVVGGQVEIALGCSIVFFMIYGSIANGFRPLFKHGRWWSLIPMAGVGTSAYLLVQFAMLSLRREGFEFDATLIWRVLGSGLLAAVFAPILYALVKPFGALLPQDFLIERNY